MRTIVTHVVYAASVSDVNDTNPPWAYEILVGNDRVRHSFLQRGEGGSLVPQFLLCQAPIAGAADR